MFRCGHMSGNRSYEHARVPLGKPSSRPGRPWFKADLTSITSEAAHLVMNPSLNKERGKQADLLLSPLGCKICSSTHGGT